MACLIAAALGAGIAAVPSYGQDSPEKIAADVANDLTNRRLAAVVARFTPEIVEGLTLSGQLSDPKKTLYLQSVLEGRLEKILELEKRASQCGAGGSATLVFNPGWHTSQDLRSMLVNAEALLRSAIERRESRGAHARSDFPKTEDQLTEVNYMVERTPQGMSVKAERRPTMPDYLAQAVEHSYTRYTPEEIE